MSDGWPRIQSLPADGHLWLLTWLGPLFFDITVPSQRQLLGVLSRVHGSDGQTPAQLFGRSSPTPDQLGLTRLISFAVGELPMLTAGSYFRDRAPLSVGSGTLTRRTVTVDLGRQRIFRLDETPEEERGPVLSQEDCLLDAAWPPMARGAGVGLPQGNDPFAVCVPATEILRWCYGSSSRMLQAVLSRELSGVIEEVRKTLVRAGTVLELQVPDGFVEQDAPTLGWLATDPAALETAEQVDLGVLVATRHFEGRGRLSHPGVLFPAAGVQKLTVLGRVIPHEPQPRFLVHRILRTTFKLPFQVRVPQFVYDPRPPEPGTPPPAPRGRRRGRVRGKTATLVSKDEPRRKGSASLLPALESQFSGVTVLHRPVQAGEATPVHTFSVPAPTGAFSTGLSEDRHSSAHKAILTLLKPPKPVPDPPVDNDAFEVLREVFKQLRTAGAQVREIPVNNPGGLEARFAHWHHADGSRVACLVAAVQHSGSLWYVLEQERDQDEYGPLLLASRPERRVASMADLSDLLDQAEGPNTWPRLYGVWTLIHVRHGFRSAEAFAKGLQERMGWKATAESTALS